nr:MAG TPA: hypothetical protein [Caudoviricetes sp.]
MSLQAQRKASSSFLTTSSVNLLGRPHLFFSCFPTS